MEKFHSLVLQLLLLLLVTVAAGTQFKVGGSKGWTVPTDPNTMSYNQWAEKHRFQIGDSLLFVYPPVKDSVLLVDMSAYNNCNTSSFIDAFSDGNSVFTLTRAGPFYFISGNRDNCLKNESMVVIVLADRRNGASPSSPPVPSPPGTIEVLPPPPSSEFASPPPPPNGASSRVEGFIGTVGVLIVSLFFAV